MYGLGLDRHPAHAEQLYMNGGLSEELAMAAWKKCILTRILWDKMSCVSIRQVCFSSLKLAKSSAGKQDITVSKG